ncbi:DUF4041 domain-containing protein [Paenibacillus vini]|uniref:DUF4041 domain-containing protein n=1 Tax=Paenibacillus vini TaxID=1476024 RepID=UPI0025B6C375|nr:DUF4041 domain-containing protein [Paenibacillus vini]MDN4070220.1 DUF4041 domain-containing protein [Paenibacillus vini]
MSVLDIFRIGKIKSELKSVRNDLVSLQKIMKPEHQEILDLSVELESLNKTKNEVLQKIENENDRLSKITLMYKLKSKELVDLDEQLMLQDFSLYKPKYDFTNSSEYKERLDSIRDQQKVMIKVGSACSGNQEWRVNNSQVEGKKMVNDMIKLVLRSFNNECDSCISNVKFNNIDTYEKKISKSFETLNKLGRIMKVEISNEYLYLKKQELYLAHEYQTKKQEEKEEQKLIREQLREEAKLQKEIEEARKSVEKEQKHYSNALSKALSQLEKCDSEAERENIQIKIQELTRSLDEIQKHLENIDYREANQKAGYVYVISNLGAFGENVYKIGMTRRLDPYDRINELGDASVPFNFDVHAMIFSDNAPRLEAALHNAFENKKLNLINSRREFFNVTIDEIERVIRKNHDRTVEFIKTADAEQYRESLTIRNTKREADLSKEEVFKAYKEAAVSID